MGLYSDDEDDAIEIKTSYAFDLNTTPKQVKEIEAQEQRDKEKAQEARNKKLPAFLNHVTSRQKAVINKKTKKEDFLKSMLEVRNRHTSDSKEDQNGNSYKLNSVIDLNNQPKVKKPRLNTVVGPDGCQYVEYNPGNPNEYDAVAARLNRVNTKNFAELAKQRAKETLEKLNRTPTQPKKKPPPGLDYSSSDDDDHRQSRGGGAQIAPPSFLSESGPEKSGTTPMLPMARKRGLRLGGSGSSSAANKKDNSKIVPLFQRAKQSGLEKRVNPKRETTVVVVKNVVGPGQVDPDLKDEVVEECSKYGRILASKIIDLSLEENPDIEPSEAVRIFLKYQDVSQSKLAVESLHDRFFAGRTLGCSFFDVGKFDKGDLVG